MKMVLCDPGRIEAGGLGMGDLFGDKAVAFGGRCVVEQAAEEAEAKGCFRAAPALTPTACPAPRMSPASLLLYFAAQGTPST
jgi:hypothetical protein